MGSWLGFGEVEIFQLSIQCTVRSSHHLTVMSMQVDGIGKDITFLRLEIEPNKSFSMH